MHLGRQDGRCHVLESIYEKCLPRSLFVKNVFQKSQNKKITPQNDLKQNTDAIQLYGLGLFENWPVLKKKWAADPSRIQQIYGCVDCACCILRPITTRNLQQMSM
jgi:hypothetical protein